MVAASNGSTRSATPSKDGTTPRQRPNGSTRLAAGTTPHRATRKVLTRWLGPGERLMVIGILWTLFVLVVVVRQPHWAHSTETVYTLTIDYKKNSTVPLRWRKTVKLLDEKIKLAASRISSDASAEAGGGLRNGRLQENVMPQRDYTLDRPKKSATIVRLQQPGNISEQDASSLFPRPLELLRNGVSLDTVYACPEPDYSQAECTCQTANVPPKQRASCCERCVLWSHKMGHDLAHAHFAPFEHIAPLKFCDFEGERSHTHLLEAAKDSRMVLLLRNIYASLVSGYLYHAAGKECWLNPYGRAWKREHSRFDIAQFTRGWQRFTSNRYVSDDNTTMLWH